MWDPVMIEVDGSILEGGGQILRMAVTYSAILGEPIRVNNIRTGRSQPGLKPQHLTTLEAVAKICRAMKKGFRLGSREIEFYPRAPRGGEYKLDIGTAGSISLLLQCLTPIAALAASPTKLTVRGGTNVRWSPPINILTNVIWEATRAMGFKGSLVVIREGFYPKGGGIVEVDINPIESLRPLKARSSSEINLVKGISLCGKLPGHVAERQTKSACEILNREGIETEIKSKVAMGKASPLSPGSVICLWVDSHPQTYMGSSSLGEIRKPAELVGKEAAVSLVKQIGTHTAVDKYTADNLVLWCSLASGVSTYSMSKLSLHTKTSVEIARLFTGVKIAIDERKDGTALLECRGIY